MRHFSSSIFLTLYLFICLIFCLFVYVFQTTESKLSVIREVQCQVCSLLHQMFIADPYLAKLVHFQVSLY